MRARQVFDVLSLNEHFLFYYIDPDVHALVTSSLLFGFFNQSRDEFP
jgi:hypothetical protein